MIKSMTAFGRAVGVFGGLTLTIEMRSVNNRFLECSAKLPRRWSFLDEKVKPFLISKGVTRGKIDISVTLDGAAPTVTGLTVDREYTDAYIKALCELRDAYNLPDDVSVMTVAKNPAVFTVTPAVEDEAQDEKMLFSVLSEAIDAFLAARTAEGARIEADLRVKLDGIIGAVSEIEKLSAGDVANRMVKLRERISVILAETGVEPDEARLLTECAVYADKIAVDEETVRLRSHIKAFNALLDSDQPIGRSADFTVQEMNREINTVGSKCCDAEIAKHVVFVKTEIEKIREQIQNIE